MKFRSRYNLALKIVINAVLVGVFLCILTPFGFSATTCPPSGKITCPCGSEGQLFLTFCDPQFRERNDPCEKFRFCESCSNGSTTCSTCPVGFYGPYCVESDVSQNVSNTIHESFQTIEKIRTKRDIRSCPDLQGPKLGSFRCWFSRNEKECTGRCLPGHSFRNREVDEIVLKCIRGRWVPESSFPPCVSEGHCDLQMTGAGSFNCTTNSRGTFCDIRCTGHHWVSNRFFCYPGHSWDPPLPHCIREKGVTSQRVDCKCQNGGTCDVQTERCRCPENFQGRFCEQYVRVVEASCQDPGPIAHGERIYSAGHTSTESHLLKEGATVIYTCRDGFALVGSSLLTCLSSGTWSSVPPKCNKIRVPPSTTTTTAKPAVRIFCRDPGFIANGDRWTTEGRASSRSDTFAVGKSVVFSCREGYALQGLSIVTCQASRQWSNVLPECKRIQPIIKPTTEEPDYFDSVAYCKDPGVDPNGKRIEEPWIDAKRQTHGNSNEEFPQGFKLKYTCNKGYILEGDSTLLCLFTGVWSGSAPICQPAFRRDQTVYCEDPGDIANGRRMVVLSLNKRTKQYDEAPEYPEGVKLKYSCLDEFELIGEAMLTCMNTGEWSAPPPECL